MSKIQDAINVAKQSGRRPIGHGARSKAQLIGDSIPNLFEGETLSQLLEVEPSRHLALDDTVLADHRIINREFPDDALRSYKMLRTQVMQKMIMNQWSSLGVAAPEEGTGNTVSAINLAITIANQGSHEVFLVDLNFRNPKVSTYLGISDADAGMCEYLSHQASISGIAWDVGIDNLTVLPTIASSSDSSDLITSDRLREMLAFASVSGPKSIVICDLPPILTADDALAISPFVDSFLIVLSEGETTRQNVVGAFELLRDANICEVLLNKSRD